MNFRKNIPVETEDFISARYNSRSARRMIKILNEMQINRWYTATELELLLRLNGRHQITRHSISRLLSFLSQMPFTLAIVERDDEAKATSYPYCYRFRRLT